MFCLNRLKVNNTPPHHPFLIIDLYFIIPPAIAQIFNPIAELVIPIGIPSKEAKSKIDIC